jgi:hypothetical protein
MENNIVPDVPYQVMIEVNGSPDPDSGVESLEETPPPPRVRLLPPFTLPFPDQMKHNFEQACKCLSVLRDETSIPNLVSKQNVVHSSNRTKQLQPI